MADSIGAEYADSTLDDKFTSAIHRFSSNLSDLREFSETVESLVANRKLKKLEAGPVHFNRPENASCQFDVKPNPVSSLPTPGGGNEDNSLSAIVRSESNSQHLQRVSLISLVSVVESFMYQLLHWFFQKHPSAVTAQEKQFTFEELSGFSNLDDARAYLMCWKIENLLRGSYENWIEYFRGQHKLELSEIAKHHEYLVENFQRRHLLVHNDGVVNQIYLSRVDKSLTRPEMLNKKLAVSREYLFSAIDRFESSFLQLAFELWEFRE